MIPNTARVESRAPPPKIEFSDICSNKPWSNSAEFRGRVFGRLCEHLRGCTDAGKGGRPRRGTRPAAARRLPKRQA